MASRHRIDSGARDGQPAAGALPHLGQRRSGPGVVCDLQAATPYALTFANRTDVICLLFGSIDATTAYDGGKPRRMRFEPLTIAWHPAGGQVQVSADRVRGGFAALSYSERFLENLVGDVVPLRPTGSRENIASPSISHLAAYARVLLSRSGGGGDRPALELVAGLAYLEALRATRALHGRPPPRAISRGDVRRIVDYIEAEPGAELSYAALGQALDLPVATLGHAFRRATGQSLHRFVLDRRVAHAREMIERTAAPLAEVACACGFASQQHMTAVFTRTLGVTPGRCRAKAAAET